MANDPLNPLSTGDYTAINNQLRKLHDLQPALEKAQACGIDCQEHEQHRQYLIDQLTKLKTQYFPNKP